MRKKITNVTNTLEGMAIKAKINTERFIVEKVNEFYKGKEPGDHQFIAATLLMLFAMVIGVLFNNSFKQILTNALSAIGNKLNSIISNFTNVGV